MKPNEENEGESECRKGYTVLGQFKQIPGFGKSSVFSLSPTRIRGLKTTLKSSTNVCQNELQLPMETVVGAVDFATAPRQHLAGHVIVVHISGDEWCSMKQLGSDKEPLGSKDKYTMDNEYLLNSSENMVKIYAAFCGFVSNEGTQQELKSELLSLGDNNLSNVELKRLWGPIETSNCPLKELSLEKCNLSVASCQDLASLLTSTQEETNQKAKKQSK
ncbi:hypothetical protein EI555_014027, partial [Monodon monoceros]